MTSLSQHERIFSFRLQQATTRMGERMQHCVSCDDQGSIPQTAATHDSSGNDCRDTEPTWSIKKKQNIYWRKIRVLCQIVAFHGRVARKKYWLNTRHVLEKKEKGKRINFFGRAIVSHK